MLNLVIESKKLKENIEKVKNLTDARIIAQVNANGRGLGLDRYIDFLIANGIDFFAVTDIDDAIKIRSKTEKDILYLGNVLNEDIALKIIYGKITAMISSDFDANLLNKVCTQNAKSCDVHIKVNVGINRYGFDRAEQINEIRECKFLNFKGIFTEFYTPENKKAVDKQISRFNDIVGKLYGFDFDLVHVCGSYETIHYKDYHFNCVRVGRAFVGEIEGFSKVSYLQCEITDKRSIRRGEKIGNQTRFKATKDMKIAVVNVGNYDGFSVITEKDVFSIKNFLSEVKHSFLKLGNKKYVEIRGKKCEVLARVSYNTIIVDITNNPCKRGEYARILVDNLHVETSINRKFV